MRFGKKTDARILELREVPLFSACNPGELLAVAKLCDEVRFPARTELMHEGQAGREVFVVIEGEASVSINGTPVATLGPGEVVGEMALIEQEPRTATVVANTPMRALVMTRREFTTVLDKSPAVARKVLRTIAHRLRDVQAGIHAA